MQEDFDSPQDVTLACLSCHTERGKEVLASSHWNWERKEFVPGQGIRSIGKKNLLNNFCVGVSSNVQACGKCHSGYGYVDDSFDFLDPQNIDCLVCHDNTGTYVKTGGGMPASSVDMKLVAQHVGRTTRANCGSCHSFGGGGNNVKHGDLEQALFDPTRDFDVHMAGAGADLECAACHTTVNHHMMGKLYSVPFNWLPTIAKLTPGPICRATYPISVVTIFVSSSSANYEPGPLRLESEWPTCRVLATLKAIGFGGSPRPKGWPLSSVYALHVAD